MTNRLRCECKRAKIIIRSEVSQSIFYTITQLHELPFQ